MIFFFVLNTVISCCSSEESNQYSKNEKIISNLIKKYPSIVSDKKVSFSLTKTIILDENLASIKVYIPDSLLRENKNRILVIENSQGNQYGIPIFSNDYRKYWRFNGDMKTGNSAYGNSLFENEFINAINKLGLNDNKGTGFRLLMTIFTSIMNCEPINEYDQEYITNSTTQIYSDRAPSDNLDDCDKRGLRNWNIISNKIKPRNINNGWYNVYFDRFYGRIFLIKFPRDSRNKISKLELEVYRQDCNPIAMIL